MSVLDLSGALWRKSSYSGGAGNGGECVEVAFVESQWRKSSYSTGAGNGGNCVEVAFAGPAVAVRDSKHPDDGAVVMPAEQWRAVLAFTRR